MRVLQVLPRLDSGGVERGTLEIARALVEAGHDSRVISAGGRLVAPLEAAGSRHILLDIAAKRPRTLLKVLTARRLLKTLRPDILHLRSRLPAWIFWLAWRSLPAGQRPGLVTTVHGLHSVNAYSAIITRGERVIAVSEACRAYILENYPGTDPERIRVIHRGIDPAEFPQGYQPSPAWREDWYRQYPQLAGRFVITLPGRLTRLKGHIPWLRWLAGLREQEPRIAGLVVGGEDPRRRAYARELHQTVRSLGLEDSVFFTGNRQDIREIYAVSNLVMSLSSRPESFGRTVLEPLSMGVPVIAYAQGGTTEIMTELFPEGRIPPGRLESATPLVWRILHGSHAPVRRNHRFLLARMQQQTLDLYRELAAR